MNFWDTSALIALGVDEPHRQQALDVLEEDDRMVVWWGSTMRLRSPWRTKIQRMSVSSASTLG